MSSETRPFTFVQVSDVHLDSKLLAVSAPLTATQRTQRNKELLDAFVRALELARMKEADAVFVVGDLWENETVTGATIIRVRSACELMADTPIVIVPGNRDAYDVGSPYRPAVMSARGLKPWPKNVIIFDAPEFQTLPLPNRPDVAITARAFVTPEPISERLLANTIERSQSAAINILLFHGMLDGYTGPDNEEADKLTAPFSSLELKQQGFTYAALGHCHDYCEVRTEQGLLLGAYAGCVAGRNFHERGPRCVILGTIEPGRPGRWNVQLEPIEVDARRLIVVSADISGLSPEDMLDEISMGIEDQQGRRETDIICLHLEGRYRPEYAPKTIIDVLRKRFLELIVVDESKPDYLGERYDQVTTEWKYIEALTELKKILEMQQRGTTTGAQEDFELSSSIVEDALIYGLDALKQKKVTVKHVD